MSKIDRRIASASAFCDKNCVSSVCALQDVVVLGYKEEHAPTRPI